MNDYLKYLGVFLFLIKAFGSHSQPLILTESPEDYQLYARDERDSAEVKIRGELAEGTIEEKLSLKVLKEGIEYDKQLLSTGEGEFSFATKIDAGLHVFRFELYLQRQGRDSLYFVADSVVCGDAYLITGQSNSHPSSTLSTFTNPYCRSFGVKTGYEPYTEEDKKVRWGRATGNCPGLKSEVGGWFIKNPLGVGVWGMELSRLIVEKHKVPVCIINGGSGSSSIEENMLYPEQPSLETSFGRLAYRVDQAGLKDKIKAIFWHQGETNSANIEGYKSYFDNFDQLQTDWRRVYQGLEKIYLFQLHQGCGREFEGFGNELREVQNQIAKRYEYVEIMSTVGVPGHDGCHFSYEGYLEFAARIFPLVSRDFYAEKSDKILSPPALIQANYSSEDEISLFFDQPIAWEEKREVNGKPYFLKDQFFFKKDAKEGFVPIEVISLRSVENRVVIKLAEAVQLNFITYLPGKFYSGTKEIYNGPWLTGRENGLGALSFHHRSINSLKKQGNRDPFRAAGYHDEGFHVEWSPF